MNVSKHLECEASWQLPELLLVIYTLTLSNISPKSTLLYQRKDGKKISDILYIRVCIIALYKGDIIYYYQWQVQQVPDKWRDACKLPKCIKFGVVSYNN